MNQVINKRLIFIYIVVALCIIQDAVDLQMAMFLYHTPKYECVDGASYNSSTHPLTMDNSQCNYQQNGTKHNCKSWKFDQTYLKSTVVTDLKLICDKSYLELLIVPLRNLASVTFIFIGFIGDVFGRKKFFIALSVLDCIMWFVLDLVPLTYASHLALRIIKSMCKGSINIGYVLVSELTPFKYRDAILLNYYIFYGIGIALASAFMKTMQYWNKAYLLSAICNIYVLLAPFVLLESPRWLLMNNREKEAKEILIKLDQFTNEVDMHADILKNSPTLSTENEPEKYSITKEFIRYIKCPKLFIQLLVLLLTTFTYFLIYSSMNTNLNFALHDIFINAVVLGLIEVPASPLSYYLSYKFSIKRTIIVTGLLTVIIYALSPSNYSDAIKSTTGGQISHAVLTIISKLFLITSWNTQLLLFVVLSPTNLRNIIVSVSSSIGVVGSAVGAFIGYYYQRNNISHTSYVPNLIYCVFLLVSIVLLHIFIPNTDKLELPNTVEECKTVKEVNKTKETSFRYKEMETIN